MTPIYPKTASPNLWTKITARRLLIIPIALILSLALALPALAQGPELTAHNPITNTVATPLTSNVVFTYSAAISAATVTSQTVAVHSMMRGLVTETHSVNGNVVTVDPATDFFPGELVYAVATTQTTNIAGAQSISATQWQFNAEVTQGYGYFEESPVNFDTDNNNTYSLAWGDFDNDGDLDLAAGVYPNGGVKGQNVIYPNNGDGTLDTTTPITFGADTDNTRSVAWGDFDNDGDLDLAVGNYQQQNTVYLNNGDGSFSSTVDFGPGNDQTYSLAWGDFDNDGDLDLAVGNYGKQNAVYPNNSDGTFDAAVNFGTGSDATYSLAAGDFDDDGDLDLAVGNYTKPNVVYPNNGDGTFGAAVDFGTGSDWTYSLAAGDFDNDGDLDLAVGNLDQQNAVYPNNGDGTFGAAVNFGTGSDRTYSLAAGDFDHDGDLDLAVGNSGKQNAVYPNNGDGTFGAALNFGTGSDKTYSLTWGDVDNDGDLDLAAGNSFQQDALYLNVPPPPPLIARSPVTNTVTAPLTGSVVLTYSANMDSATVTSRTVAVYSMMRGLVTQTHSVNGAVITVDPPRDFFPGELVYTVVTSHTTDITGTRVAPTQWQFNAAVTQGHGYFDVAPVNVGSGSEQTYSTAWGDFDNDGDLDLAVGYTPGGSAVYLNNGDGTLDNTTPITFGAAGDYTYSVAWGDVDNDGDLDLAVGSYYGSSYVYRNNGNGTFDHTTPVSFGTAGDQTRALAWGDFDNDGDLDLAAGKFRNPNVVYPNNGDGTFGAAVNVGTSDATYSITWGDYDDDGDLDLAVGNYYEANYVYRNNGDRTFTQWSYFSYGQTYSVAWGDYDNDGDLDLAVGYNGGQNVVYPNTGGAFGTAVNVGPGNDKTYSVAWGDFDNDGNLDLAVGNDRQQNAVYPGNGDGTFGAAVNFGSGSDKTRSLTWGDVDNDGDLDLAVGNYGGQNAVYLNEPPPDVTLNKSVSPESAKPGDSITYTLTFSNAGATATGVVITDSVPVSVTNVSVISSGVTITATGSVPNFVWIVADLSQNEGGVITLTGTLTEPLAVGYVFTNTAEITCTDDDDDTNNTGEVGLTITNAAPVAATDVVTTTEEIALTINPLTNDRDPNGNEINLVSGFLGNPAHGEAVISSSAQIVYTPTTNFAGVDNFTYSVSDGTMTTIGLISVTVTNINDAPVITSSTPVSVTMSEDGSPNAFSLTLHADDPDTGDTLTWTVATQAINGTATVSGTGSSKVIGYAPDANWHGEDSFTVQVSDGTVSDTVTVSVTVESVNDAPVAVGDAAMVRRADNGDLSIMGTNPITIPVLLNDSDPSDGITNSSGLTITAVGAGSQNGVVAINSNSRWVNYTPATTAFTGTETFTYTVSDGGLEATATVTVTVVNGDGGGSTEPGDSGGETIIVPDTGISGTITVTVQIPAGVATDTFALVYNKLDAPSGQAPEDYVPGGIYFTLDAYLNQVLQAGYVFTPPITITFEYSDADVAAIPGGENSLELFYWDGSNWSSDGITVVQRDTDNNRLIVSIAHLTEFALFGRDVTPIYLPVIVKNFIAAPDLVITELVAGGGQITVTVKNQGNTAVSEEFWLDVYFNPTSTPGLNKPWQNIAPAGATWGVTAGIPAGESLTLTVGDGYYVPQYSSGSFPTGAQVYGYVDSVNYATGYGAVYESNESNNLFGSVTSTAGSGATSLNSQGSGPELANLPQR